MKPTLVVLAAGMGSRYGGLKQLDGIGPNGETIMDYSVFDAVRAGFGKIVFIIRHSFETEFKQHILEKYSTQIPVEIVFQELDSLPEGYVVPEGREKPWGTNHAILMAKDVVKEPFAVINADDFYGADSFRVLADFLTKANGQQGRYCMVGYRIGNTLSENGTVSRGECSVDGNNHLVEINERTKIQRNSEGFIFYLNENDQEVYMDENTPVSMNMWGFTPDYFGHSYEAFKRFLDARGGELKSEFYIPSMVNELLNNRLATCEVLDTTAKWFGVTYAEDKPNTIKKVNQLIEQGVYPKQLWK